MDEWERTSYPGIYKGQGPRGARYKVFHRDPAGRQRTKTLPTIKAALAYQRSILSKRDAGTYPDPDRGRETLGEVFDRYLEGRVPPKGARRRAPQLSENTKALYRIHWRLYVEPVLGARPVRSITRGDVEALLSGLQPKKTGANGDSTREHVYRLIRQLLDFAVFSDLITANPAALLTVKAPRGRTSRFLSGREVERLVAEHPERYRAFVRVACWCGPRFGELSALRVRHLDFMRRRIEVSEAAAHVGGRRIEGPTKTGRARSVPVPSFVWEELVSHLERFSDPKDRDAFVFTAEEGGPLRPENYRRRVFAPAAARAGITPAPTIHDLRHTAASLMAQAGYSLRMAGEVLGHSTQSMTTRYSHLFPEDLEALTARLDEAVRGARGESGGELASLPTGRG